MALTFNRRIPFVAGIALAQRKAQIALVAIMVPILLSAAFAVYSWRPPSLELVLGVGVGVFIEAFLVALSASKGGKKKGDASE